MTPDERRRAGQAVRVRIAELGTTVPRVARDAGVDPSTLRSLIHGARWPTRDTRRKLCKALGWPDGEINRRAYTIRDLGDFSLSDLLAEVTRRIAELEQDL